MRIDCHHHFWDVTPEREARKTVPDRAGLAVRQQRVTVVGLRGHAEFKYLPSDGTPVHKGGPSLALKVD